jgi:methyl-accepting chemotaxis protein
VSIKYKQLLIIVTSVALPLLVALALTNYFSRQTQEIADVQAERLVDADLDHLLEGTTDLLDLYLTAKKEQRNTAVKSYLRAIADDLHHRVAQTYDALPADEAEEALREVVLAPRIAESGYAFGMNSDGVLTIHPKSEGKDLSGSAHIDTMRERKEGFITYHAVTAKRDKAVYYRYFEPLDLIIAPGVFIDELEALYDKAAEAREWNRLIERMESITIGEGGYFWALSAAGEQRGEYMISPGGGKTGVNGWGLRDADGVAYIQEIVEKGKAAGTEPVDLNFRFNNTRTGEAQRMMVRARYFEPLDWVIGVSVPFSQVQTASTMIAGSFNRMNTFIAAGAAVLMLLGGLFAWWSACRTIAPIAQVMEMVRDIERGHLQQRLHLSRRDELGEMGRIMDELADNLQHEIVDPLNKLAEGNLDFEAVPRDDEDVIRGALKKLGTDLNDLVQQVQSAGDQIATGAGEVADSSQALSQGATEQASSLEEISASVNQMAGQTQQSAENAGQADALAGEARKAAEKGSHQMAAMVSAMGEISQAGSDIGKILKTIDEIAFQTNLLALNAAVEAARAGQHGKGFAVVAEEVRNLAARSARAASETADLIEGTVSKTARGTEIAEQTESALKEIVVGVDKVSDLVAEISAAAKEQAEGIGQVNTGLGQIDQVTQQNTASAEQSAAAAEELSGQAAHLQQLLQRFRLKDVASMQLIS